MPWLLLLHISTLVFWFGALLYLPTLVRTHACNTAELSAQTVLQGYPSSMPRAVFTLFATPVALLTIASGTAVFLSRGITAPWLIVKLTLVVLLVFCHVVTGYLILRVEHGHLRFLRPACIALTLLLIVLISCVLWLVLAKPYWEA